jgi:transcriptional regulator with XRE-family HTH domain
MKRTYAIRVDRLHELLFRSGKTLADLEHSSGITERNLSRICNGQRTYRSTIQRIASALGTTPDALCDECEGASPEPTQFRLRIRLGGSFQTALQRDFLTRLTDRIVAQMKEEGIAVSGRTFALATSQFAGTGSLRIPISVCASSEGRPSWLIASIRPSMLKSFLEDGNITAGGFPFGELIDCGWGEAIPPEAIERAAQLLDCDPEQFASQALLEA